MARACDQKTPFDLKPAPRRPEPAPLPELETYQSVTLVFGPRGRFAGFRTTTETAPPAKP